MSCLPPSRKLAHIGVMGQDRFALHQMPDKCRQIPPQDVVTHHRKFMLFAPIA
jgi:hypothetical protein